MSAPEATGAQTCRRGPGWIGGRVVSRLATALAVALIASPTRAQLGDPLPSWNDGPAKRAILGFIGCAAGLLIAAQFAAYEGSTRTTPIKGRTQQIGGKPSGGILADA